MKLPCYVINLNESESNFEKQKPFLIEQGIEPIRFSGVNGRKDEHLKYKENISKTCLLTCPKSVMGIGLSHVLLAQHLQTIGEPIALVLEDDAYPKVCNLLFHIQRAIQEVPDDWDIIKLHCGGCKDDTINLQDWGSLAAYIINASGIDKLAKLKVSFSIDVQLYNDSNIKTYKSKYNLFWTDESSSTNRGTGLSFLKIKFGSGEQNIGSTLGYRVFRVPFTNIEFEVWEVALFLVLVLVIMYLKKLF